MNHKDEAQNDNSLNLNSLHYVDKSVFSLPAVETVEYLHQSINIEDNGEMSRWNAVFKIKCLI
jgi:hypothetical protein